MADGIRQRDIMGSGVVEERREFLCLEQAEEGPGACR
jgi:hypothetical protein